MPIRCPIQQEESMSLPSSLPTAPNRNVGMFVHQVVFQVSSGRAARAPAVFHVGPSCRAWRSLLRSRSLRARSEPRRRPGWDRSAPPGRTRQTGRNRRFPAQTDDVILPDQANNLSSLGGSATAESLTFSDTSASIVLGTLNDYVLSLGSGGIATVAGASANAINSAVQLTAPQTWTNNSTSAFTLAGSLNNGGYDLTTAGSEFFSGVVTGSGGLSSAGPAQPR